MPPKRRPPEDRFWEKVNKTEGCWLWTAATTNDGYGVFGIEGKGIKAHRVSLMWHLGRPLTEGLQIDHLCGVRNCVNPLHLEEVTHQENILRRRNNNKSTPVVEHCGKGHLKPYVGPCQFCCAIDQAAKRKR